MKQNEYDVVHAHYSFSAFIASLSGASPLVVSLMGSDVKKGRVFKALVRLASRLFKWKDIIVKSEDMKASLGIYKVKIIPNGVNFGRFKPMDEDQCREKLGWDSSVVNILFPSNPSRPEKNYQLLESSLARFNERFEVHFFINVPNEETPLWYNAADVVVMTSLWEGSPNAIKEAMACNRIVVSTPVGDVPWLTADTEGVFITEFEPGACAEALSKAIAFKKSKQGVASREKIDSLGLSSVKIAKRLLEIYNGYC